ncbi:MarR family transcriptional regulator [Azospirillum sp. sgz301742]
MGASQGQTEISRGIAARAGLALSATGAEAIQRGSVPARQGNASPIPLRTEAAMQHHEFISKAVSTDREITLEALRVFTYLSRRLHFDQSIPVLQSELADALGMQRPNVNRAIKLLETKQILLRESKLGRAITFRLNPELGSRAA